MAEPVSGQELSEEQLKKVEEFIEEEEGSFNRYRGWLATFLVAVAVASSAFHLYAAYSIVRTDYLREIHVGIVLFLAYMLFPIAPRADRARGRGGAPHHRMDNAHHHRRLPRLRVPGTLAAFALDAPRLRRRAHRRPHVHDARGHLRHRGRRLRDAHHPLHHLRGVPAVLGRGSLLPRFLVLAPRRQAHQRRACRRARLLPARWAVRLGCSHHRHHRLGGVADAREVRLQEGRRGRTPRRRRPGCHPLPARAGCGRLHHRRVLEGLVPRGHQDGDDPDAALLLFALPDGGGRS